MGTFLQIMGVVFLAYLTFIAVVVLALVFGSQEPTLHR